METFVEDLSHSSDAVHLFDFEFVVEEDFFELLESFEGDLSHSIDAVHSFDFTCGVDVEFFELLEIFVVFITSQ
mgnify:CR=1 FL=1